MLSPPLTALPPPPPLRTRPFALVGWTGSRQYNRFLRDYCNNNNMMLTNHGLFNREDPAKCIPYEAPSPVNGTTLADLGGTVRDEMDVFKLLGVMYLPPHLRNA